MLNGLSGPNGGSKNFSKISQRPAALRLSADQVTADEGLIRWQLMRSAAARRTSLT